MMILKLLLNTQMICYMLARSKVNSIESKISETLTNNEISHGDFMTTINEEKKYWELNESIRMMNSQRSDIEKKKKKKSDWRR